MIKIIKTSLSEKVLLIFLILLGIFSFSFFFIIKNKCLFVENINPKNIQFTNRQNIAIMNVECGNVIIELNPKLSPNAVKRFKYLIQNGSYDRSAFYKVIKDTLVQAGDLEYGNIDNINYYKVGSGKSSLGTLKSELSENFKFDEGSVVFARNDDFNTEDSEFFITLKKIPLYEGEYTPIGKVIYGLDALKKIKAGNKVQYVLRPDFINYFKVGSGKSGLGTLKSELNENFKFDEGSVVFARNDELNTEDSEFFITLKKIPLYVGEYTPIGKVIYGLDALKKIKVGNKVQYVLRPDFINYFKLLE